MSEPPPAWQSEVYCILLHPTLPVVLLLPEANGWTLPSVRVDDYVWICVDEALHRRLQEQFGGFVVPLFCAAFEADHTTQRAKVVYTLETGGPLVLPSDAVWVTQERLVDLPLAHPEHRSIITAFLADVTGLHQPSSRPTWSRPGWFAEVVTWITTELAGLGYGASGTIELVKSWALSCVLRVRVSEADIYFKVAAKLPLFVNEATVLAGLARLFPDHVPAPLHIDGARRWMLLPDFGPPIDQDSPVEMRAAMLRLIAQMQAAAAGHVAELLDIGCIDRRLDVLATQIVPLLEDHHALTGLDEAEATHLQALAPRLKAMCHQLAGYHLPYTLVHGDLHLGNVALHRGRMLIFDWTDAAVAHLFFDLINVFAEEDRAVKTFLREAYLSQWTDVESMPRLLDAWALAEPLSALHQAVSYQHIVANLEPASQHGFGRVVPHLLRQVLETMPS